MIETPGFHQPNAPFSRLGQQEFEHIHIASLGVLARVGIEVHNEKALEGGEGAVTRSSGSQSLFSLIFTLARPGDNIVTSLNIFGEGYKQAASIFPQRTNVEFRFVDDPIDPIAWDKAIDEKTRQSRY